MFANSISARIVFFIAILSGALNYSTIRAHEFDDGHVERSVSYLLRDQQLTLEYSVGLNPNTMYTLLGEWNVDIPQQLKQQIDQRAELTQDAKTAANPSTSDENTVAEGDSPGSAGQDAAPASDPREPEVEDPIDLAIEQLFRQHVEPQIRKQLELQLNDQPIPLTLQSVNISPRHHVNLTIRYEVDFPAGGNLRFRATDANFLKNRGGVRYAFKGLGRAMVLASNVEPVLVRAERVDLGKIRADKRLKYTTVETTIAFIKPKASSESTESSK